MIKKKILCLIDYYLPGNRSGGPVESISNLVEKLGDDFEIKIICRDRDLKSKKRYSNIHVNSWNIVGKAKVFYLSQKNLSPIAIKTILKKTNYDLIYFNSFFSYRFTIIPLLFNHFGFINFKPCIIAPRGEFSPEALKINAIKKKYYLKLFMWLKLYKNLVWQASSKKEKRNIKNKLGKTIKKILVVPDLTRFISFKNKIFKSKTHEHLKLLFLSRISPMKNLEFLLQVLKDINESIELSIYGPKEDLRYWKKCIDLINDLPKNIIVNVYGVASKQELPKIFERHDLFILPTKGENFGHVIIESLSAGLPVLISDKTPWLNNKKGGLEVLSLKEKIWRSKILFWSKLNKDIIKSKRKAAFKFFINFHKKNSSLITYKNLFNSVLKTSNLATKLEL